MIASGAGWAARHGGAVVLAAIALVAAGEWSRRSLAQDAIADISDPQIVLMATWPLHPASEVAEAVTRPITAGLANLPGARAVRGASMTGLGYVDVVFTRPSDLAPGRAAIAARIDALRARLPAGVQIEIGPLASSTGWVLQYALVSEAVRESPHGDGTSGLSLVTLRRWHDEVLRPALARVGGVAEVASLGGDASQAVVAIKPEALREAGLAFSDVVDRLTERLDRASRAGSPPDPAELGPLEVVAPAARRDPGAGSGRPPRPSPRIDQLGQVRLVMAMTEGMADLDGHFPVVGGIVIVGRDADPASVNQQVRRVLAEQRPRLPAGVELLVLYDRSELAARVNRTLLRALAEEVAVVVLVVLVFLLHGRSAVVPLATLLVVLALTFIAMRALGIPATVMSLGGIAIALGMAVDAELVALEACHRWLERNPTDGRRRALLLAARALTPAILTSLVIAGISFLPALVFTGETGRLVRPLVLTKTLVIGAATLVTLLVAPALRDRLIRGRIVPELANPLTRGLVRLYRPVVSFALERPWFTLATAALAAASCLPLLGHLGEEFLTRIDEGELLYMPTTSADVPPELAGAELRRQDQLLLRRPEVAMVFGKLGRADSATDPAPCSMVETLVRLKPRAAWPERPRRRWHSDRAPAALAPLLRRIWPEKGRLSSSELLAELDAALRSPGWTNAWTAPVRARMDMMSTGLRTPVGIRIVSERDRSLHLARTVRAIAATIPGTRSAAVESPGGETVLRFEPDPSALARHQADEALVRRTAALVLAGGHLGQLRRDGRSLPLRVLPDLSPRPPGELLREATVRAGPPGHQRPVPLALLGRVRIDREPAMLRTEGGRSVSYVLLDLDDGTDLQGYLERARAEMAAALSGGRIALGPGEALEWAGQYDLMAAGRRRLMIIAPLVLLSMLGLLFLQFRSVTETLIVLGSVPLALVGSVWTIFLLGYALSPPVWVGLISVVGLAMQTGVVMVVYIDQAFYRRVRAGQLSSRQDIVAAHAEGTVRRLRPKIMTVATMAAALLPLLWSEGAGAEIMKRVAAPMVGGLLFSAFVTLEVIPVLYTLWRHRQLRRAQRLGVPLTQIIGPVPGWAGDLRAAGGGR